MCSTTERVEWVLQGRLCLFACVCVDASWYQSAPVCLATFRERARKQPLPGPGPCAPLSAPFLTSPPHRARWLRCARAATRQPSLFLSSSRATHTSTPLRALQHSSATTNATNHNNAARVHKTKPHQRMEGRRKHVTVDIPQPVHALQTPLPQEGGREGREDNPGAQNAQGARDELTSPRGRVRETAEGTGVR